MARVTKVNAKRPSAKRSENKPYCHGLTNSISPLLQGTRKNNRLSTGSSHRAWKEKEKKKGGKRKRKKEIKEAKNDAGSGLIERTWKRECDRIFFRTYWPVTPSSTALSSRTRDRNIAMVNERERGWEGGGSFKGTDSYRFYLLFFHIFQWADRESTFLK